MKKVQMILMTKSYKDGGYCATGIDVSTGDWIRLVSNEQGEPIKYAVLDRDQCKNCLDVLEVELLEHVPVSCQTENYLIDSNKVIKKVGSVTLNKLLTEEYLSSEPYIFGNTSRYLFDYKLNLFNHSLQFVIVQDLNVFAFVDDNDKIKNRCSFNYKGNAYNDISLTDPDYRHGGEYNIIYNSAAIIVSIPNKPYKNGLAYKFVAKVFPLN